jgi:TPR repeat protein
MCSRLTDHHSVDEDEAESFKWYLKSANQGFEDAQAQVAMFYALGRGVDEDNAKAFYWHKKAAKAGIQKSMVFLGYYYSGKGVDKDIK